MSDDEREYLWKHFAFNAEQRLRAFHFFVVFSGFANGGILVAFDKNSQPMVFVALGGFICLISIIFLVIDVRSRELLEMTRKGLIRSEESLMFDEARIFTRDRKPRKLVISYTYAFRALFLIQFVVGAAAIWYGWPAGGG
jgi:hypothetical protein